jgi:hypothetical protein
MFTITVFAISFPGVWVTAAVAAAVKAREWLMIT